MISITIYYWTPPPPPRKNDTLFLYCAVVQGIFPLNNSESHLLHLLHLSRRIIVQLGHDSVNLAAR